MMGRRPASIPPGVGTALRRHPGAGHALTTLAEARRMTPAGARPVAAQGWRVYQTPPGPSYETPSPQTANALPVEVIASSP